MTGPQPSKMKITQLELDIVKKASLAVSHKETFDRFWAAYPKKRAKPVAWKSWQKLKLTRQLYTEIMQGLNNWKKSIEWQQKTEPPGRVIPLPATFINQERWADEIEIAFVPIVSQARMDIVTCHKCGSSGDIRQIDGVLWCRDCLSSQ